MTADDKIPLGLQKKQISSKRKTSYQNSKNNNNIHYLRRLKVLQEDLNNAIEVSKLNYNSRITHKLTQYTKNTKVYRTLLKRFFNNKKIPLIPPVFPWKWVCNRFQEKAELFNSFFAKQCFLIRYSSELPLNLR